MNTENVKTFLQQIDAHLEEVTALQEDLRSGVRLVFNDSGLFGATRSALDWHSSRLFTKGDEYSEVLEGYKKAIEHASKQIQDNVRK